MLYCLAAWASLFLTKSMPYVSASSSISSRLSRIASHSMHSSSSEYGRWDSSVGQRIGNHPKHFLRTSLYLYLNVCCCSKTNCMLVLMKYVEMNEYIQKKTAIRGDVSSSLSSMRKLTCVGLNFLDKVGFCQHHHWPPRSRLPTHGCRRLSAIPGLNPRIWDRLK